MFIDITRVGGDRALRVAVAAIAFMDATPQGCALHLVGGQSLHVEQSPAEIEARCAAAAAPAARIEEEPAPVLLLEHKPADADTGNTDPAQEETAADAPEPAETGDRADAAGQRADAASTRRKRR